jgi:tRNA A37 threonylcarbamoyladenosine dehydratase
VLVVKFNRVWEDCYNVEHCLHCPQVGSHAANMLARSGISRIRLIDFDQVTLSSLNRHAVATMQDVGKSKAGK